MGEALHDVNLTLARDTVKRDNRPMPTLMRYVEHEGPRGRRVWTLCGAVRASPQDQFAQRMIDRPKWLRDILQVAAAGGFIVTNARGCNLLWFNMDEHGQLIDFVRP